MPDDDRQSDASERATLEFDRRGLLAIAAGATAGTGLGSTTAGATDYHDDDEEDDAAEGDDEAVDDEVDDDVEEPVDPNGLFLAAMTGDQQPGDVETDATGAAAMALTEDGTAAEYAVLVSAIEDANQAHIHLGPEGEEGPVAVWLHPSPDATEPQLEEGRFDGILASGTFTEEHLTEEVEGQTMNALLAEIDADNAYVNVHTEEHPGGEIRGQLTPVEDVATALLEEDPTAAVDDEEVPIVEDETEMTLVLENEAGDPVWSGVEVTVEFPGDRIHQIIEDDLAAAQGAIEVDPVDDFGEIRFTVEWEGETFEETATIEEGEQVEVRVVVEGHPGDDPEDVEDAEENGE